MKRIRRSAFEKRIGPVQDQPKFLLGWGLVTAIIFASLCPSVTAQRPRGFSDYMKQSEVLPAPRQFQSLLEDAEAAIARKQWSEATLALGTVLGLEKAPESEPAPIPPPTDRNLNPRLPGRFDPNRNATRNPNRKTLANSEAGQDYFLDVENEATIRQSMRSKAAMLMATLPEEGAMVVELRYGVTAQAALEDAVKKENWSEIARVASLYRFTQAGRQATVFWMERALASGNAFAAANLGEQLLLQPSARQQFGVDLAVLTAACWHVSNMPWKSMETIKKIQGYWPQVKTLRWEDRQLTIPQQGAVSSSDLDAFLASSAQRAIRKSTQWSLQRGRVDGNGHADAGPAIFRWDAPMHPSPHDTNMALQVVKARQMEKVSDLPTHSAIVVGSLVLAKTMDQRLLAFDQLTGKRVWNGLFDEPTARSPSPLNGFGMENTRESPLTDRVVQAVWADAATGLLSSDGQLVYGLSPSTIEQAIENLTQGANPLAFGARIGQSGAPNVLRAWSIESQGKIPWEVGGELGKGEPLLAGSLFLGPPTPYRGELLSLVEINGEVYLVSLSPSNGKLLWWQQLASNSSLAIAKDPARRNLAASPSVYGNMVLCPTLSGFIVAYDLDTRSLAWAFRYAQSGATNVQFSNFQGLQSDRFDPFASTSIEYQPVIANGCVVVMPCEPDAEMVYGLDLQTGAKLWEQSIRVVDQPRTRWRYVGGVWNQHVLLVSDTQAMAVDLRTGERVWSKPISFGGSKVVGRGVRNEQRYYVPLQSQELLEIDIEKGVEVAKHRMGYPLGNLIATERSLVSYSPTHLTYSILRKRLQSDVDVESLKDPSSFVSSMHRAEILLSEDKVSDALDAIEKAYERNPTDPDCLALLSRIGIAAIRSDFEQFGPRVRKFDQVLAEGLERPNYLTIMIDGYMKHNDRTQAMEKLLELSSERSRMRIVQMSDADSIEFEKGVSVQTDRWIAARIEQIWESASIEHRQGLERLIREHLERMGSSSLSTSRRCYEHVKGLSLVGSQSLRIAQEQRRTMDNSSADLLLEPLLRHEETALRTAAAEQLVEIYLQSGRKTTALEIAKRFGIDMNQMELESKNGGNDPDFGYGTGLGSLSSLEKMPTRELNGIGKTHRDWPSGIVRVQGPTLDQFGEKDGTPFQVIHHEGDALRGWRVKLSGEENAMMEIVLTNPWGYEQISIPFQHRRAGDLFMQAHVVHNLVFLELPTEIMAIDTLSSDPIRGIRWRQPMGSNNLAEGMRTSTDSLWGEKIARTSGQYSILAANSQGIFVRTGDQVQCLSLTTGDKLWSRKGFQRSAVGGGEGNRLLVVESSLQRCSVLDCRDGSLLATRKLPESWEVKAAIGTKILFNAKRDNGKELLLWDPANESNLLQDRFLREAVGTLFEGKYFVALDMERKSTETNLVVWNLESGQKYRYPYADASRTQELRCMRFGDIIVVMPYSTKYEMEGFSVQSASKQLVSGPCMGIHEKDGRPLWQKAVVIKNYYFHPSQLRSAPVLVLPRRERIMDKQNGELTSLAFLDVRTGETIREIHGLKSIRGVGYSQRVDPESNRTRISFSGYSVELDFTDEEGPPAPLSSIGDTTLQDLLRAMENVNRKDPSSDLFGNEFDAIKDGMGNRFQQELRNPLIPIPAQPQNPPRNR